MATCRFYCQQTSLHCLPFRLDILCLYFSKQAKMPRCTSKNKIIDAVYEDAIDRLIYLDSSDETEAEEIERDTMENLALVDRYRYGDIQMVPRQKTWLNEVFPKYDENRFRQITRLSYAQFDKVYNCIKDNEIFFGCTQSPVSLQLAVTLYRLGLNGAGASLKNIARLFGTGDGSSIVRMTRRVIKAVLDVESHYLYWPDEKERAGIVAATQGFLPQCIGFIDGTHIPLDEAPGLDKDSYFDKNKNYSLKVQIVCDHKKRIRHYVAGYPGSCHDSRLWNECNIVKDFNKFFSNDQWICGDKGYPLSNYVLTPFRENATVVSDTNRKMFNKYLSMYRVIIEHVNGALKETFSCLKGLKLKINDVTTHESAVDCIRSCLVLYNITMPLENYMPVENVMENDHQVLEDREDNIINRSAEEKRIKLCQFISENQ